MNTEHITDIKRCGASPGEWAHFGNKLGLLADLLPVVADRSVPMSPTSQIKQLDGKTPSTIDGQGYARGLKGWPTRSTTAAEVERWARDPRVGIGLVGRTVRAIDIDIDDPHLAAEVRRLLELTLGPLPCRGRDNSSKCLFVFRVAGPVAKRKVETAGGIVELLGDKQQFLVAGVHKSGARYEWEDGLPDVIPTLTSDELDAFWSLLVETFGVGDSVVKASYVHREPVAAVGHDRERDLVVEMWEGLHGERGDGRLDGLCPWADAHSPGGAEYAMYIPAGYKGQGHSGFRCLHAHCDGRNVFQFLSKIGVDAALRVDDFDVAESPDEQAAAESAAAAILNAQRKALSTIPFTDVVSGEVFEVVSPAFSDDQLALRFAGTAVRALRWSPGMSWMANDGEVWRRDDHLTRYALARTVCRDVARLSDKVAEAKALASSRTVNAVISLAQSDPRLMVPVSEWDSDPMLLNTPDVVVDLHTGATSPRRGHLVTRCARVSPSSSAGCPTWLSFLRAAFQGDDEVIAFVQRLLGYTLTGDRREQKLFFFWGEGSNGKSTLADLILWILGSYALKLSSAVLMQTPHDKHPTELAQLQGIRLAMSSELEEGAFFNEARVKELTGDAVLSARFMRGDFFEFAMQHKHVIVGNHRPRLRGGDPAMARRLVLVPFKAVFSEATQDKALPEKLKAEAPAILAWLIEGAVQWGRNGLGTPAAVLSASAEYLANHDDVQQWLDDRCSASAGSSTRAGLLYADFVVWKLARGEKAPSLTVWGERMALKGFAKGRSGGIVYAGLALKPSAPVSVEEFA